MKGLKLSSLAAAPSFPVKSYTPGSGMGLLMMASSKWSSGRLYSPPHRIRTRHADTGRPFRKVLKTMHGLDHSLVATRTERLAFSGEEEIVCKLVPAGLSSAGSRQARLTAHTKHSLCHLAPIALTATSGIGFTHALHFGLCRRK